MNPSTQNPYAAFLAPSRQRDWVEPEHDWWHWRDQRVHVARARPAEAPVRVIVVHGAGGHSGALWPLAGLVASRGLDVAAPDLPLYGRTEVADPAGVRYGDWVDLLVDFVTAEDDGRPLLLLGASIGGLLAADVAARNPRVDHVAATCLLDPSDWRAMAAMTRFGPLGVVGRPLSLLVERWLGDSRLARVMLPVSWVANLARMSRNPELSRMCATDPLGGGVRVPVGFLTSYIGFGHTPPGQVTTPVSLLHPSRDAWTPVALSTRYLARVAGPSRMVLLRECGHFPIEEPGLDDLVSAIDEIIAGLSQV
ncbi:alpha/beta hydrolase [Aestuariimicrobium sp. Y1814]|uniref:alpha/beta hydrolase n=1 Tax=Aestuariimicrobium sp. Y1814 TaxID=3418742 RepID=UPI003DA7242B